MKIPSSCTRCQKPNDRCGFEPEPSGVKLTERSALSMRFPGCECVYFTTLRPTSVPRPAPPMMSLAQCALLYIRETPTSAAAPYITVPTYHRDRGAHISVSRDTVDAKAKALIACPDGKDR